MGIVNDSRGAYVKINAVKPEITKDHFKRVSQGMEDPFKLNYLSFESQKAALRSNILNRKLTSKAELSMKNGDERKKAEMINHYRNTYGIIIRPREYRDMISKVDMVGLEIMLNKKLADHKAMIAATMIQANFRGFICRKWYSKIHEIRVRATIIIQRILRKYLRDVVGPRQRAMNNLPKLVLV